MHKWVAMTIFPRANVRTVGVDELMILYAMIKKIRVSPVRLMVEHWKGVFQRVGSVECTSLVTRIFEKIGLFAHYKVAFLPQARVLLDEAHVI